MEPAISVVIATIGRAEKLRRTLAAFDRLHPDTPAFEVIVVLDGAEPAARAVADEPHRFPLRVFEQPRGGNGPAKNLGARHAVAPYLVFLNDDTRPDPGCLLAHLNAPREVWAVRPGGQGGLGPGARDHPVHAMARAQRPPVQLLAPRRGTSRCTGTPAGGLTSACRASGTSRSRSTRRSPILRSKTRSGGSGWRAGGGRCATIRTRSASTTITTTVPPTTGAGRGRPAPRPGTPCAATRRCSGRSSFDLSGAAVVAALAALWPGRWRRDTLWDLDFRWNLVWGIVTPQPQPWVVHRRS